MTCPRSYDASRQTPLRQCRSTDFFSTLPLPLVKGLSNLFCLSVLHTISPHRPLCCHYLSLSLSLSTYTSIHLYFIQSYNHIFFISHLDCRIPNPPPAPQTSNALAVFSQLYHLYLPVLTVQHLLCYAFFFQVLIPTPSTFSVQIAHALCFSEPRYSILQCSIDYWFPPFFWDVYMEIALGAIPKSVSVSGGFLCEQFPARDLIVSFFRFCVVSFCVIRGVDPELYHFQLTSLFAFST